MPGRQESRAAPLPVVLAPADALAALGGLADAAAYRHALADRPCPACVPATGQRCARHRADLDAAVAYEQAAARIAAQLPPQDRDGGLMS